MLRTELNTGSGLSGAAGPQIPQTLIHTVLKIKLQAEVLFSVRLFGDRHVVAVQAVQIFIRVILRALQVRAA